MKQTSALSAIFFTLICSTALHADIYVWIDENGVKNFTNSQPPEGAQIFIKDSEVSQVAAADKLRMDSHKPQSSPDTAGETLRLREELEALKKQLAQSRETSPGVAEDMGSGGSVPTEEMDDSSEEAYIGADPSQSYTEVHVYNYPYYGYGGFAYGHGSAIYYHQPHYFRKNHYGYYNKYHPYRHHRGKHHKGNLKRHKHKTGHPGKHQSGYKVKVGLAGQHDKKFHRQDQYSVRPRKEYFREKYSRGTYPGRSFSGFRARYNYVK